MLVWSQALLTEGGGGEQPLVALSDCDRSLAVLILLGPDAQDATLDLLEVTNTPLPDPATLCLLALGGLAMLRRRKQS